jgi:hypothetical protein
MTMRCVCLGTLILLGCVHHPSTRPPHAHVDRGTATVHRAPPPAPDPEIIRALRENPRAQRVLAANGEPDSIEVIGGRGSPKRAVLTYAHGRAGKPRRIVLALSRPARAARARAPADPGARGGTPTARQSLECPIDAERSDCRALCAASRTYEWCR